MRNNIKFFIFISLFAPSQAHALSGDVAPYGSPDNKITIGDAVVAARMTQGLIPINTNADVAVSGSSELGAQDGLVTITDALLLAKTAAGIHTAADQSYTNSLGMIFRRYTAASFNMGSSSAPKEGDEKQHMVAFTSSFYMQATEVTQRQWKLVMGGNNPSYFSSCGDDCPVDQVSWNDVSNFVTEMNKRGEGTYRLPTEAEWEYAARVYSDADTHYFFGEDATLLGDYAWYYNNSTLKTKSVASKLPNAKGLYDMYGNVSEWVSDWYSISAYDPDAWPDESKRAEDNAIIDPQGPPPNDPNIYNYKVIRGGSWNDLAVYARTADRNFDLPGNRGNNLGFRLLRSYP